MTAALKILASGQVAAQLATITGTPTGGTWTPYVNGLSAGTVAYNASAATLQTALRTVLANVTVSGSAGGPYTITCPTGVPCVVTLGANALTGGTAPSVTMSGVDTTVYTVPAGKQAKVATAVVRNNAAVAVAFDVSVVPSGGTVDGTHKIAGASTIVPLAAGDSTSLFELAGDMWDTGAFVSISCSAAGALNYKLTGAVL